MYEKKLIILIGPQGQKGTLKIERSNVGVRATVNAGNVPLKDYMLAVICDGIRYDYPLGGLPGESTLAVAEEIRIDSSHFTVYERFGEPVLYGTLDNERLWWGNLPNGRANIEKKIVEKGFEEEEWPFEFSKSNAIAAGDIFPSIGNYSDDEIATVNYYEAESVEDSEEKDLSIRIDEIEEKEEFKSELQVEKLEEELQAPPSITLEKETPKGRKADFYERVKEELQRLFSKGERYSALEDRLPFTKWVKISYDGIRHYIVGLVGQSPDYICYGLPSVYSKEGCARIGEDCVFLPLNHLRPQGEGYWLLYQDAKTGETLKKSVIE